MAAGMVGISIYMGIGDEPPQRVTQIGAPLKLEIGHGRAVAYLDLNELIDAIRVTVEQIYKATSIVSPAKGGSDDVR